MRPPVNPRLGRLHDYPFRRLDELLADLSPPAGMEPIVMSIGEPHHSPPSLIAETIARHAGDWGRYPPTRGTPDLRAACSEWLTGRFSLPRGMMDPASNILPLAGTREGLFSIALATLSGRPDGTRASVLIPDPFYQVYRGAAVLSGGKACFLPASRASGFLPDLDRIASHGPDEVGLIYLCTPANPQGAVASMDYLVQLVRIVRDLGALLVVDECYSEIYTATPPPGVLEACRQLGGSLDNVLAFHSLSKRSSAPGLRSGFVAGDAKVLAAFLGMRSYSGGQQPLPIQAAAAVLWRDEDHVVQNRRLYRRKFDAAAEILGIEPPAGGFFLWLDVEDGERMTRALWRDAGVRVMPGSFLASDEGGEAHRHIRVALVPEVPAACEGLRRIASTWRRNDSGDLAQPAGARAP